VLADQFAGSARRTESRQNAGHAFGIAGCEKDCGHACRRNRSKEIAQIEPENHGPADVRRDVASHRTVTAKAVGRLVRRNKIQNLAEDAPLD